MSEPLSTPHGSLGAFREKFPPSCPQGFTRADLERYFGDRLKSLYAQLGGQTGSICEGRVFNHATREYEPDDCEGTPHGFITYVSDVYEWYLGRPVSDW